MAIAPSTPEELLAFKRLVRRVRRKIKKLAKRGKRVHFIWDVDGVLVSSRSDDVFALLKFDVKKYFEYEERLIAETLDHGPWSKFAREVGQPGRHVSQDIVTARSSFLALRVTLYILQNYIPMRWQLFVGHQSKKESYRIILDSFRKDPDVHVFMVDDAKKHVDSFTELAAELGMAERSLGIVSPQIRDYDEDEILREKEMVLNAAKDGPHFETVGVVRGPGTIPRSVCIVPDPAAFLQKAFWQITHAAYMKAMVDRHREWLENLWNDISPTEPKTDEGLYHLFETFRDMHCP